MESTYFPEFPLIHDFAGPRFWPLDLSEPRERVQGRAGTALDTSAGGGWASTPLDACPDMPARVPHLEA